MGTQFVFFATQTFVFIFACEQISSQFLSPSPPTLPPAILTFLFFGDVVKLTSILLNVIINLLRIVYFSDLSLVLLWIICQAKVTVLLSNVYKLLKVLDLLFVVLFQLAVYLVFQFQSLFAFRVWCWLELSWMIV